MQVCKVPSTASLLIYDFNMFREQLQLALQQRHSYEQLYQLTQLCHIRLSFVKGPLCALATRTRIVHVHCTLYTLLATYEYEYAYEYEARASE